MKNMVQLCDRKDCETTPSPLTEGVLEKEDDILSMSLFHVDWCVPLDNSSSSK